MTDKAQVLDDSFMSWKWTEKLASEGDTGEWCPLSCGPDLIPGSIAHAAGATITANEGSLSDESSLAAMVVKVIHEGPQGLKPLPVTPESGFAFAEDQGNAGIPGRVHFAQQGGEPSSWLEGQEEDQGEGQAHRMHNAEALDRAASTPADLEGVDSAGAARAARLQNAEVLRSVKSDRSVVSDLSNLGGSEGLDAYNCRRARRRQSNRDSARRTRQRKLTEVRELQEQVALLADDKTRLTLQYQDLSARYHRVESRMPQWKGQYEAVVMENYRLLSEVQSLRAVLGQHLAYDGTKQPMASAMDPVAVDFAQGNLLL